MIKSDYPIIDAHVHVWKSGRQGITDVVSMVEEARYDAVNAAGLTSFKPESAANNIACLLLKKLLPGKAYSFGSLHYPDNGADSGIDPAAYARFLMDAGFDGIKMLEGKPTARKRIGIPLCDKYYSSFYSYVEQNDIPILFHVNDPANFWDAEKVPPLAVERGNFYGDGTFPSKEAIYSEAETILETYPNLRVIWAHFYFLSENIERAARFLDSYPNSRLDITPGPEMYFDFSANVKGWRKFFEKYNEKIILGTDNPNPQWRERINGMTAFLETDAEDIPFFGGTIKGIALPESMLNNIYGANFAKVMRGQKPKPVNVGQLEREFLLVEKLTHRSAHKSAILQELAELKELASQHDIRLEF
jgi:predicted TIM-barrel fold metal-dependent hydrolase